MPSAQAIKAGEAYVELTLKDGTSKGLQTLQSRINAMGRSLTIAGGAVAGFGAAIGAPLQIAVNRASDAAEQLNAFRVIFRDLSGEAEAFAATLAGETQRSVVDVRDSMQRFFSFFKGQGFGDTEALTLAKQLSRLAIDVSSLQNVAEPEVIDRFLSALRGEEGGEKLSIFVNKAALDLEFLNQGMNVTTNTATEMQKVLARLGIVFQSQAAAQGDAQRTADGYANRLRGLSAAITDLAVAVGGPLLQSRADFVAAITDVVKSVTAFVQANQQLIPIVATVAASLAVLGTALLTVGTAAIVVSSSFAAFRSIGSAVIAPLVLVGGAATKAAGSMLSLAAAAAGQVVGALRSAAGAALQLAVGALSAATRAVGSLAAAFSAQLLPAIGRAIGAMLYFAGQAVITTVYVAMYNLITAVDSLAFAFGTSLPTSIGAAATALFNFLTAPAAIPIAIGIAIGALFAFDTAAVNIGKSMAVLGEGFKKLVAIAVSAGKGIYLAFVNRDWGGLFKIIGVTIKAAWYQTLATLVEATRQLFGGETVDVFLSVGNVIYQTLKFIANGVLAVLKPVFAVVRTLLGFVGKAITTITDLLGLTVDASQVAENLQGKADQAKADLDKLVSAQEQARKKSEASGTAGSPLDAAKDLIPDFAFDLEPFDPALAKEWMQDARQYLPEFEVPIDIPEPELGRLEDVFREVKDLGAVSLENIFGKSKSVEDILGPAAQAGGYGDIGEQLRSLQAGLKSGGRLGVGRKEGFTTGGFSGALASLKLADGGSLDRTARATEATAANTKKIADRPAVAWS